MLHLTTVCNAESILVTVTGVERAGSLGMQAQGWPDSLLPLG